MFGNFPVLILCGPALVLAAALALRASARRWPGDDGDLGRQADR